MLEQRAARRAGGREKDGGEGIRRSEDAAD
jgi:hypothetical protein